MAVQSERRTKEAASYMRQRDAEHTLRDFENPFVRKATPRLSSTWYTYVPTLPVRRPTVSQLERISYTSYTVLWEKEMEKCTN